MTSVSFCGVGAYADNAVDAYDCGGESVCVLRFARRFSGGILVCCRVSGDEEEDSGGGWLVVVMVSTECLMYSRFY